MSAALEQALVFPCGGEPLVAVVHPATESRQRPGVLVVVGGPQYRVGSHRQFVLMARALSRAGYAVMRFDCRGMGDSGGAARTFHEAFEDIRAAIDAFVASVPGMSGVVLWGLCDAASAILMHAANDQRVRALILVNPWVRTATGEAKAYIEQYYGRRLLQRSFWLKLVSGRLNVLTSLRDFARTLVAARKSSVAVPTSTTNFVDSMSIGLQRFAGPVLVLISGRDLTAAEFVALCRDEPSWRAAMARPQVRSITLADADHTFSNRSFLEAAVRHCVEWLEGSLPAATASTAARSR